MKIILRNQNGYEPNKKSYFEKKDGANRICSIKKDFRGVKAENNEFYLYYELSSY